MVIALGDPAGIGAEVTLKALAVLVRQEPAPPPVLLVGCRSWLQTTHRRLMAAGCTDLVDPDGLAVEDLPLAESVEPEIGRAHV